MSGKISPLLRAALAASALGIAVLGATAASAATPLSASGVYNPTTTTTNATNNLVVTITNQSGGNLGAGSGQLSYTPPSGGGVTGSVTGTTCQSTGNGAGGDATGFALAGDLILNNGSSCTITIAPKFANAGTFGIGTIKLGGATQDQQAVANNSITVSAPAPAPVPTLSQWALIILSTTLAGVGLFIARRRFVAV